MAEIIHSKSVIEPGSLVVVTGRENFGLTGTVESKEGEKSLVKFSEAEAKKIRDWQFSAEIYREMNKGGGSWQSAHFLAKKGRKKVIAINRITSTVIIRYHEGSMVK